MSRNVIFIVAVFLALSLNLPSRVGAMPKNPLTILPEDCKLLAGQELSLTLNGVIPSDTAVTWEASDGGITSMLPGSEAIFVAPFRSTVVTITVSISPVVPGTDSVITRQCTVTSPNSAPDGVASTPRLGFPRS